MIKIIVFLLIFLNFSCDDNLETVQCSNLFERKESGLYEITCVCREYLYSMDYVGKQSNFELAPIKMCENMIGNPLDEYDEVSNFWEKVRQEARKRKNKKR